MALPLAYNLRNVMVRKRLTLATAGSIALVVAVFIMVMALARGMDATYVSTGDPRNLLVMRKGSTAESSSQITRATMQRMRYLEGVARDARGDPLASAEIIVLIFLDRRDAPGGANILVRGMGPMGLALRPSVRIVEGRMFRPGLQECLVSTKIARRFRNCRLGESFRTGRTVWHVVGVFDGQKTAYESEIWVDADEARTEFRRDFYGSLLLRAATPGAAADLTRRLETDRNLQVAVLPETEYYREQTKGSAPLRVLGGLLAAIMSIGAAFAAMNTMYASVGARTREIGTLRTLGFPRRDIYAGILLESAVTSLLGGALGCLVALPLNGVATGTFSPTSFAEIAFEFRITGELLAKGLLFALAMGVAGGLLPARLAARKPVLDALRSV
jgi:putative ABC transport system permease protein